MNKTPTNTTCRCGYTKDSKIVAPRNSFSKIAWFFWCVGISSCPTKVELYCPVCGNIFETITDPKLCNSYRYR